MKRKHFIRGRVPSQGSIFKQMKQPRPVLKPINKHEIKLHVETCKNSNGK